MKNPSSQWTERERLAVIQAITRQAQNEEFLDEFDVFNRIRSLTGRPASFLEAHRTGILKGLPIRTNQEPE